jgi:hypothetical protein
MRRPTSEHDRERPEIEIEVTPQAVARIQCWIALLAADQTAPAWSPVEDYRTPDTLRAAAQWLVDNGHVTEMDHELVCVLLALFSINLRSEMGEELDGRLVPRDAA